MAEENTNKPFDKYENRLNYLYKMRKAYSDMYYEETLYRTRLKKEREKNRRNFKVFVVLDIIVGALFSVGLFLLNGPMKGEANSLSGARVQWVINALFAQVGMYIVMFTGIGLAVGLYMLIHYARRWNKEIDNRDSIWKTYDEMDTFSDKKMQEIKVNQTENAVEIEATKQLQFQESMQKRLEFEAGESGPACIAMDELLTIGEAPVEETGESEDQGDPLRKTWSDD